MNLVEYLHLQCRLCTQLLINKDKITSKNLKLILNCLGDQPSKEYLNQYSQDIKDEENKTNDIITSEEMETFFDTGDIPLSFLFKMIQKDLKQSIQNQTENTDKNTHNINNNDNIIIDVQGNDTLYKVDINDLHIGDKFKWKLVKMICFKIDLLHHILQINLENIEDYSQPKKEILQEFIDISVKIFDYEILDLNKKINFLKLKLEILYKLNPFLNLLFDDGSVFANLHFIYGMKSPKILNNLKELENEKPNETQIKTEISI